MVTMNIALPEPMKQFVYERVSEGGYSSVSEYIRGLIREDQRRRVVERTDALRLDGRNPDEPIPAAPDLREERPQQSPRRRGRPRRRE